jgi:hypothetical protein
MNGAQSLYVEANSPDYRLMLTPLNHNRMLIPPVQAILANGMVESIIQSNEDAMRVDAPCGKQDCKCKK